MKKVVDKSGEIGYNNQRCQRESKDNGSDPWKRYSEDRQAREKFTKTARARAWARANSKQSDFWERQRNLPSKFCEGLNIRVWSWLRTNAGGVPNTCKSSGDNGELAQSCFSGGRVSNAWAICPVQGDNNWKQLLIPHETTMSHGKGVKD